MPRRPPRQELMKHNSRDWLAIFTAGQSFLAKFLEHFDAPMFLAPTLFRMPPNSARMCSRAKGRGWTGRAFPNEITRARSPGRLKGVTTNFTFLGPVFI